MTGQHIAQLGSIEHPGTIAVEGQCLQVVQLILRRTPPHKDIMHITAHLCAGLELGPQGLEPFLQCPRRKRKGAQRTEDTSGQGRILLKIAFREEFVLHQLLELFELFEFFGIPNWTMLISFETPLLVRISLVLRSSVVRFCPISR